ncbi:MAG: pyrroline-5-carboxylate reductase [Chloroflexi bacterium]|nr:MAG: pyrroline-5-carboxylate reductase [Chloroflexota bacterium]
MRVAFIGGGNMGEAIIRAVVEAGVARPGDIAVSDIMEKRRSYLAERDGVLAATDNKQATWEAEVVVLAVKPDSLAEVMQGLNGCLEAGQLVLSIVAGVPIERICSGLGHKAVVRAMPNMPAQVGEGVAVWTASEQVNDEQRQRAQSILSAMGKEMFVSDERYIDMATAVSGSGPAYVFLVIESLIDGAVHIGLPRDLARDAVLQTVIGSARMVERTAKHPAELRNLVTSPGGTTAEGLLQLEEGGLRALLTEAIIAAYEKARMLQQ